jgi:hypothetical protein
MEAARATTTGDRTAFAHASGAIYNLRGAFIFILITFHASLAYLGSTAEPASSFDAPPYIWLAFPIVDSRRFYGFDLYCAWIDSYVMAMMFFISGLFVVPSLKRKGAARFAAERLARLGPPFLLCVLALTPLALYPVFHLLRPEADVAAYLAAYRALPFEPTGPAWFLWLLIVVSLSAAGLHALAPGALDRLGALAADARSRPRRFLGALAVAAVLAYLPLALVFGPFGWTEIGPVSFQTSRPLLYAVYFFAGAGVGAAGLGGGLLARDGALARNWRRLCLLSPLALCAWLGLTGASLSFPAFAPALVRTASGLAYVAAGLAGAMMVLALAVRFGARPRPWIAPLADNALGIYVLHYPPVVWLQYALTGAPWPALVKWALVCALGLPASLALALAARSMGPLARLIGEPAAARPAPPRGARNPDPRLG